MAIFIILLMLHTPGYHEIPFKCLSWNLPLALLSLIPIFVNIPSHLCKYSTAPDTHCWGISPLWKMNGKLRKKETQWFAYKMCLLEGICGFCKCAKIRLTQTPVYLTWFQFSSSKKLLSEYIRISLIREKTNFVCWLSETW